MTAASNHRHLATVAVALLCTASVALLAGCPIPPGSEGQGRRLYKTCRSTNHNYWLYVPHRYDSERRYPLIVTLHGMKPYDVSRHHVEMWGKQADLHGYLVLAPELATSDTFGQFPLRQMNDAEKADVRHILACIDEVTGDWEVDKRAILLSCWSMGGYLAHYMAAEYGSNRFTAFAPLQSNFSPTICNAAKAKQWVGQLPLFVFYGTGDLPAVTSECRSAIEWWSKLGYRVSVKQAGVGHERHPELAAEFFDAVLAERQRHVEIVVTPPGREAAPVAINLWPALSSKIGEVRTYIWDFGRLSSTPSYLRSPNVVIRQPGEYPIRLTVIDKSDRKYTADVCLSVAPKSPAPTAQRTPSNPP